MTSVPMVYQQKIAEKLAVLTDRAKGMLTRIYNIKKMLSLNSKPGFLSEKQYEKAVQLLGGKKFPVDAHSGSGTLQILQILNPHKNAIMNALNLYYYTFVDIFDLKNAINDTLTTVDVCQLSFNIVLNYDLTKSYLELIALHCAMTIILSKIEDRKVVLGMFNYVFYLDKNKDEEYYKKVANYFMEIENPLKKLSEDFMPHKNSLRTAINSLSDVYPRRANVAAQWRTQQYLSLLYDSNKLLSCYHTDTCPCEYLSVESMERWIIMSVTICNCLLEDPKINHLWQTALSNSFVMALCRDEVVPTHQFSIAHFESLKGLSALVGIVKNSRDHAYKQALQNHRDKRKYLRTALKELSLVLTDQPGLLGPKALILFSALSNARDEIRWLMRHSDNIPTKSKSKILEEDLKDRQIPELIFLVEELRSLARKYAQVIQRYYVQFLAGGDVNALESLMVNIEGEEESEILSSFVMTFKGLSVKQVEDQSINIGELRAVRMDWCRMQAYMASPQARLKLTQHQTLARHLNTIAFHTRLVDTLDDLLNETSDLSLYCFYMHKLEMQFKECMEFPAQHRYSIAFPQVCAHFLNATHRLCPEERQSIGSTSVQYTHWFLKEMSEEVNQVITAICEEQCHLTDQLLPKHCAIQIVNLNAKKSKKDKDRILQEEKKPGHESVRKQREEFTRMDKLHMALTELCYAFNYTNIITVWNHGFVPREFFLNHLEDRFNKLLVGMMMYNPQTSEIAKPSELLAGVYAVMNVLQSIENYIHIDMSRIFNSVLPQQTQQRDTFHGNPTIAFNYSQWYLEVLMLKVSEDKVIYSPNHKAFLTLDSETHFQAEEYADLVELRALAELIGPYGMKLMGEKIVWHISKQVEELKNLVIQNKIYLNALRTNYDDSELVKGTVKKLQNSDNLLKRVSIIGELLSFRSLAQEALQDVLDQRIPFLLSSIRDFHEHMPHTGDTMLASIRGQIVNEMASAAGIQCDIDPALCTMLRNQRQNQAADNPAASVQDDDFSVACLLLVFIAVSLPKWARLENSRFNPAFEGHMNNAHCIAKAVNALAASLLTVQGKQNEIGDRLKEFLALASASLLRLGQETDRDVIRNRESIYLLLDQIVQESPFLTMDLLESCFPYALLRNAYHQVAKAHGH